MLISPVQIYYDRMDSLPSFSIPCLYVSSALGKKFPTMVIYLLNCSIPKYSQNSFRITSTIPLRTINLLSKIQDIFAGFTFIHPLPPIAPVLGYILQKMHSKLNSYSCVVMLSILYTISLNFFLF